MDNLVVCERCGSDACYMQEINDKIKLYHCMGCGFQANTIMTRDSEFLKEQIEILPELYKELMVEDENGTIWMPSTVNIPSQGMVFARGTNKHNWQWAAVKAIPMPEDEKAKFKANDKEYEWKIDMKTLKLYPERDYVEALLYINVLPE